MDISFITTKVSSIQTDVKSLEKILSVAAKTTRNLLWIGHPDGICILLWTDQFKSGAEQRWVLPIIVTGIQKINQLKV